MGTDGERLLLFCPCCSFAMVAEAARGILPGWTNAPRDPGGRSPPFPPLPPPSCPSCLETKPGSVHTKKRRPCLQGSWSRPRTLPPNLPRRLSSAQPPVADGCDAQAKGLALGASELRREAGRVAAGRAKASGSGSRIRGTKSLAAGKAKGRPSGHAGPCDARDHTNAGGLVALPVLEDVGGGSSALGAEGVASREHRLADGWPAAGESSPGSFASRPSSVTNREHGYT